ncbi:hypothetical protein GCM10008938_37470 [Deinococcus roseus]|uniref:Uncharacterized protein n=2 Tax=Deinococcus roseus TaxID=392414 RepID=A0ABQ2D6N6_9DEIO|nr:hypothetical protein GCM10008938_37470 [Deinococcus roseus]
MGLSVAAEQAKEALTKASMQRLQDFISDLESNNCHLTVEDLKQEPIIHASCLVSENIAATRNREKRRYFAFLFMEFKMRGEFSDTSMDVFEEDLRILADMSEREMRLLIVIERFFKFLEEVNALPDRTERLRAKFEELCLEIPADPEEFKGLAERLTRTGFVVFSQGLANTGFLVAYRPTQNYYKFKERLGLKS